MTKPKVICTVLALMSAAAIAFALYYAGMARVFMYDSNIQAFHATLSAAEQHGIMWALDSVTSTYTWLLVITNALWLGGALYALSNMQVRRT